MSKDRQEQRDHIVKVVMDRISKGGEKRAEALYEFIAVSMPGVGEDQAGQLARMVPPVMDELYLKWAEMFADRLFETLPPEQLEYVTDGEADNDAALALAYIMFMESERMEKQVAEDLSNHGLEQSGLDQAADMAASYVRARLEVLAGQLKGDEPKTH